MSGNPLIWEFPSPFLSFLPSQSLFQILCHPVLLTPLRKKPNTVSFLSACSTSLSELRREKFHITPRWIQIKSRHSPQRDPQCHLTLHPCSVPSHFSWCLFQTSSPCEAPWRHSCSSPFSKCLHLQPNQETHCEDMNLLSFCILSLTSIPILFSLPVPAGNATHPFPA